MGKTTKEMLWLHALKSGVLSKPDFDQNDVWVKFTRDENNPSILNFNFCLVNDEHTMVYNITSQKVEHIRVRPDKVTSGQGYVSAQPRWKEYYEVLPLMVERNKIVSAFNTPNDKLEQKLEKTDRLNVKDMTAIEKSVNKQNTVHTVVASHFELV